MSVLLKRAYAAANLHEGQLRVQSGLRLRGLNDRRVPRRPCASSSALRTRAAGSCKSCKP